MVTENDFLISMLGSTTKGKVFLGIKDYYIFFTDYENCNVIDKNSVMESINKLNENINLEVIK